MEWSRVRVSLSRLRVGGFKRAPHNNQTIVVRAPHSDFAAAHRQEEEKLAQNLRIK